ncbi:hypothetical protein [Nocardiopsis synnemataformans]
MTAPLVAAVHARLAAARLDDTVRAAAETLIRQLATTEVATSKEITR